MSSAGSLRGRPDDGCSAADGKSKWKELETHIGFGEPAAPIAKFLSGEHVYGVDPANHMTTLKVNMHAFLKDAANKYMEEAGLRAIHPVHSPYLHEDFAPKGTEEPGTFAKTASSHLMKVLFAARLARPDLLVAITRLASKVSCWNKSRDGALHRLFSYISSFPDLELIGTIKDTGIHDVYLCMSPDSDLAGDMETTKSTSGCWIELVSAGGLRTWPLAWRSKKQGPTASSTCEAETISMATSLKAHALPLLDLLDAALGRPSSEAALSRGQHSMYSSCQKRLLSRPEALI